MAGAERAVVLATAAPTPAFEIKDLRSMGIPPNVVYN
jgi:hypothetical protein